MILRKHMGRRDSKARKKSSLFENNDEEGDFLEKILIKNKQKMREKSCHLIRIRKIAS